MGPSRTFPGEKTEVEFLEKFQTLGYLSREQAEKANGLWISSRWEDVRKDSGNVRSRWVLREFNGGKKDLQYFAPTPDPAEVEALHVHALRNSKDLIYLDFSRALFHSPETELVFTENPEGFGPPGTVSRLLRKINGRRDGTATCVEWLSVQLLQRGFRRSKLHQCTFLKDEMGVALACHVDDGVLACDLGLEQNLIEMLEEFALVKVTGRLPANATERTEWITSLARERCRRGDTIWKRPSTKFVLKACQLLGPEGCKPTAAPSDERVA